MSPMSCQGASLEFWVCVKIGFAESGLYAQRRAACQERGMWTSTSLTMCPSIVVNELAAAVCDIKAGSYNRRGSIDRDAPRGSLL